MCVMYYTLQSRYLQRFTISNAYIKSIYQYLIQIILYNLQIGIFYYVCLKVLQLYYLIPLALKLIYFSIIFRFASLVKIYNTNPYIMNKIITITFMIFHFLIILDDIFNVNTKNWIPIKRMLKIRRKSKIVQISSHLYVLRKKYISN